MDRSVLRSLLERSLAETRGWDANSSTFAVGGRSRGLFSVAGSGPVYGPLRVVSLRKGGSERPVPQSLTKWLRQAASYGARRGPSRPRLR